MFVCVCSHVCVIFFFVFPQHKCKHTAAAAWRLPCVNSFRGRKQSFAFPEVCDERKKSNVETEVVGKVKLLVRFFVCLFVSLKQVEGFNVEQVEEKEGGTN